MEIEGSRVLVTGASSGIGAALARMLARRGATVGLVARRQDRLAEVLERLPGATPRTRGCGWPTSADVERAGQVALEAWDAFGHLDCLVNNAGVPMRRHTTKLDYATLEWVMRVNFFAPAHMTMALLPRMDGAGRGHDRQRVERGGPARQRQRGRLLGQQVRPVRLERGHRRGPLRQRHPDPARESRSHRHRDLGPPRQRRPALLRAQDHRPRRWPRASWRAMEGESFEHYVPDMRAIVESKTADPDPFIKGMAAMLRSAARPPDVP